MAESSERELMPDEACHDIAALTAQAPCRFASSRPVIIPLEDP
jgi:hypothetical protein